MPKKTKKEKSRLPTEEEFLEFIPKRADFEWELNKEGLVEIKVPKFTGKLGKFFCKVIHKDNFFIAKLDKIGSVVWQESDGKKPIKKILQAVKKKFPKEENIDQRLYLYIRQMQSLNYIELL